MTNSTICIDSTQSVIVPVPQDAVAKKTKTKQAELYLEAKRKITELEKENAKLKTKQGESLFQTAVRMTLSMVNRQLNSIVEYTGPDSPYESDEGDDCHVTWAMRMAAKRAKQALGENFDSFDGLDEVLCEISGTAVCAFNLLTVKDSAYGRHMCSLISSIDTLAELCDTVSAWGDSFLINAEVRNV